MENQTITETTSIVEPAPTTGQLSGPPIESTVRKTVIMSSDQHNPLIRKRNSLGYYLTLGIRGLLGSKKGALALLVLLVTTVALFIGKISGMEFCSAVTIISGIYAAGATATDIQTLRNQ